MAAAGRRSFTDMPSLVLSGGPARCAIRADRGRAGLDSCSRRAPRPDSALTGGV